MHGRRQGVGRHDGFLALGQHGGLVWPQRAREHADLLRPGAAAVEGDAGQGLQKDELVLRRAAGRGVARVRLEQWTNRLQWEDGQGYAFFVSCF